MLTFVLMSSLSLGLSSAFAETPSPAGGTRNEQVFQRTYTADELKNFPLQKVVKTTLKFRSTSRSGTATWSATLRDIRTDERVSASATAVCNPQTRQKWICTFEKETGNVELTLMGTKDLRIEIPYGQGVLFSSPVRADGTIWSDLLIGADESNRLFRLTKKR